MRDDVDLVYVALPAAGHKYWTLRALECGKAVLCEKPFAMNAREAQEMVSAAASAGLPLIEAFHYRFHQAIHRAQNIVQRGQLGRLLRARACFATGIPHSADELRWCAEQGGGAVMDLGCYPIHALRTLLGEEPAVESARAAYAHGVEAQAWATLSFPSGVRAEIWCSMQEPAISWDLEIVGEFGQLALSNFVAPQYGCVLRTEIHDHVTELAIDGPSTYDAQLEHVVDVLLNDALTLTGGADAVANMRVLDEVRLQALRSALGAINF
jgi:predicted dehydrogenase